MPWTRFLDGPVDTYGVDRDRPDLDGTSRLSPHLRFGTVHPRQVLGRVPTGPSARRSGRSWPGGSSTPTCCGTGPTRPGRHCRRSATTCGGTPARRPTRRFAAWPEGRTGYPAGRRRDASAGGRGMDAQPGPDAGGLVPGQGPPSGLATRGRASSSTCWSTATWPPTTTAGSGWPAPGPTPRRSTASSVRTGRRSASTPTAAMWPGTCPSTGHPPTRRRSSTTPPSARGAGPVAGGQGDGRRGRGPMSGPGRRPGLRRLRPRAVLPAPLRLLRLRHLHRPGPPDGGLRGGLRRPSSAGPSSARACRRRPRSSSAGGPRPGSPPTCWSPMLDAVPRRPGAEVTVECNPEDVTAERLATYRGRRGDPDLARGPVDGRPRAGGPRPPPRSGPGDRGRRPGGRSRLRLVEPRPHPGRGGGDATRTGSGACPTCWAWPPPPPHLSAYALTVEPGTPLAATPDRHPDDDVQADRYEVGRPGADRRRLPVGGDLQLGPARARVPAQPPVLGPGRLPRDRVGRPLPPGRAALVERPHPRPLRGPGRGGPVERGRRGGARRSPAGRSRPWPCRCAPRRGSRWPPCPTTPISTDWSTARPGGPC